MSSNDAPKAGVAVTTGLLKHLSPGSVDKALEQLPDELRTLLRPIQPRLDHSG